MKVTPVTDDDVSAYLARLGVDPGPPSFGQLSAIHRAQVERIPYETTWIHLGETWTVDPGTALLADRPPTARAGTASTSTGRSARCCRAPRLPRHDARRQRAGRARPPARAGRRPRRARRPRRPGGGRRVARRRRARRRAARAAAAGPRSTRQGPFTFRSRRTTALWHLRHDARGSFAGVSFGPPPDGRVHRLRHAPRPPLDSTRLGLRPRRHRPTPRRASADILRALTLSRVTVEGDERRVVDDRSDWFAVLADVYGLHLGDAPPVAATDCGCTPTRRTRRTSPRRRPDDGPPPRKARINGGDASAVAAAGLGDRVELVASPAQQR